MPQNLPVNSRIRWQENPLLMGELSYRDMRAGEEQTVCEMVRRVFDKFLAPEFDTTGMEEFFRFANASAMKTRLTRGGFVFVAISMDKVVGVLEFYPPNRIALLFVELPRRGIAGELLARGISRIRSEWPGTSKLTVHSSRYAEPIYEKLGFHKVGDLTTEHGISYIPMERKIQGYTCIS